MRLSALQRAAGRDFSLAVAADNNHVVAVAQAVTHDELATSRISHILPQRTGCTPHIARTEIAIQQNLLQAR